MTDNQKKFDQVIGKAKVSSALPLLQMVASEHGLRLNRASEFKQTRKLLATRYSINKIKI